MESSKWDNNNTAVSQFGYNLIEQNMSCDNTAITENQGYQGQTKANQIYPIVHHPSPRYHSVSVFPPPVSHNVTQVEQYSGMYANLNAGVGSNLNTHYRSMTCDVGQMVGESVQHHFNKKLPFPQPTESDFPKSHLFTYSSNAAIAKTDENINAQHFRVCSDPLNAGNAIEILEGTNTRTDSMLMDQKSSPASHNQGRVINEQEFQRFTPQTSEQSNRINMPRVFTTFSDNKEGHLNTQMHNQEQANFVSMSQASREIATESNVLKCSEKHDANLTTIQTTLTKNSEHQKEKKQTKKDQSPSQKEKLPSQKEKLPSQKEQNSSKNFEEINADSIASNVSKLKNHKLSGHQQISNPEITHQDNTQHQYTNCRKSSDDTQVDIHCTSEREDNTENIPQKSQNSESKNAASSDSVRVKSVSVDGSSVKLTDLVVDDRTENVDLTGSDTTLVSTDKSQTKHDYLDKSPMDSSDPEKLPAKKADGNKSLAESKCSTETEKQKSEQGRLSESKISKSFLLATGRKKYLFLSKDDSGEMPVLFSKRQVGNQEETGSPSGGNTKLPKTVHKSLCSEIPNTSVISSVQLAEVQKLSKVMKNSATKKKQEKFMVNEKATVPLKKIFRFQDENVDIASCVNKIDKESRVILTRNQSRIQNSSNENEAIMTQSRARKKSNKSYMIEEDDYDDEEEEGEDKSGSVLDENKSSDPDFEPESDSDSGTRKSNKFKNPKFTADGPEIKSKTHRKRKKSTASEIELHDTESDIIADKEKQNAKERKEKIMKQDLNTNEDNSLDLDMNVETAHMMYLRQHQIPVYRRKGKFCKVSRYKKGMRMKEMNKKMHSESEINSDGLNNNEKVDGKKVRCIVCNTKHRRGQCVTNLTTATISNIKDKTECTNSKILSVSSLPDELILSFSKPEHGIGVFAATGIVKGTLFGPVIGETVRFDSLKPDMDLTHIWFIDKADDQDDTNDCHYISTSDETKSNWCRRGQCVTNLTTATISNIKDKTECTNSKILSVSSLPDELILSFSKPEHGIGVFAATGIVKGTLFGPVIGETVRFDSLKPDMDLTHIWFIDKADDQDDTNDCHYISTSDETKSNWCRYVRLTVEGDDSNLIAFTMEDNIFFVAKRDIQSGEELLCSDVRSNKYYNLVTSLMELTCSTCQCTLSNKVNFTKHACIFHSDSLCKRKRICKVCNKVFSSHKSLSMHCAEVHDGQGAFKCNICGKNFLQNTRLTSHYKASHLIEGEGLTCNICNRVFLNHVKLRHHQRRVHSSQELHCRFCDKIFKNKSSLSRHEGTHSDSNYKFACDRCGKRFRDGTGFKVHLLTHSKVKPFPCELAGCSAAFTTKQCLIFHYKKVHSMTDEVMPKIKRHIPFTFEAYTGSADQTGLDQSEAR